MKNFKLKISRESAFSFLTYLSLFLYLIFPSRDNDWGWHYRYGEYFIKTGHIMTRDIWSWTMPGYHWANHSWAYDPILYILYSAGGFLGLSIAGAIVAFLAFYIAIKPFNLSFWQKGILAYFYWQLTSGVVWQGLRSQVLGMVFLSVLMVILIKVYRREYPVSSMKNTKYYFILPVLFLTWVNFHGTFLLGLLIFGVFLASSWLLFFLKRTRDLVKPKIFIPMHLIFFSLSFLISFLATFINPFTYEVYVEALRHFRNPLLPLISEWTPVQFPSYFYNIFLIYTAFLIILLVKKIKLSSLPYFIIIVFLFFLSIQMRRYMATNIVATLPIAALMFSSLNLKLERFRATSVVFLVSLIIVFETVLFYRLPSFNLLNYSFDSYCAFGPGCSEGLTEYLIKNPPKGERGLNFYDWGGYLIGRGINTKLFVDGRMHLWRDKNGYEAFADYQKIYYDGDFQLAQKYNFSWIIASKNASIIRRIRDGEFGRWEIKYEDENAIYIAR